MPENPERWRVYVDDGTEFEPQDDVLIAYSAKEALEAFLFSREDMTTAGQRFAVCNLEDWNGDLFILQLKVPPLKFEVVQA